MQNPLDKIKELNQKRDELHREIEKNCRPLVDLRNRIIKEMGLNEHSSSGMYLGLWDYPNLDSYYGGIFERWVSFEEPVIVSGNDCDSDESAVIPLSMYMNPTEEYIRSYYQRELEERIAEKEQAERAEEERQAARLRIFRGQVS